jgi:hypothetical protein
VAILGALLMALAGCVFALTSNPLVLTLAVPFLYQASDSATDESRSLQDEGFLRLQSCRLNLWSIRSAWLWCIRGACRFCWHSLGFTQHRCGDRAVIYGDLFGHPVLGLPFLLAGGLKIVYGFWIFAVFRKLRPPEEESGKQNPKFPTRGLDAM